jgi:hypothetical protein
VPGLVALVVGLGTVLSAGARMDGIDTLNGSYDSFFHIAAIRFVRVDQDAFLLTALQGIYQEPTFYPAVFDVLAALLPGTPIVAANALMLAMLAVLPGAVVSLVLMVVAGHTTTTQRALAGALGALAVPLFLSIPAMALLMGLWPNVLGAVCLPPALGALWRLIAPVAAVSATADPIRTHRAEALWCAALVLGAVLAHPGNVFSLAVAIGAAAVVRGVVWMLRTGTRGRGIAVLVGLAICLLGYVVVSRVLLSGMSLTAARPTDLLGLLHQILVDHPRIRAIPMSTWPVLALWALAVIGAVVSVRRRWASGQCALALLCITVALMLATDARVPGGSLLTNPWYGARERIAPLFLCALVVLAASGLLALARTDAVRALRGEGWRAPVALFLVAVSCLGAVLVPGRLPLLGSLAYTAYGLQLAPYVTPEERAFIERSAQELPADARVIGNPRDGAALYWSLGGVDTVFPTLADPQTLDSRRVARYIYEAPENSDVCGSLEKVGPTHLYVDLSSQSGVRIAPEASEPWSGLLRIPEDKLELVDREGPYALYRLEPLC